MATLERRVEPQSWCAWPGLVILTDYDCGSAYHLPVREVNRARTQRLVLKCHCQPEWPGNFSRMSLGSSGASRMSLARIEPVGFRVSTPRRTRLYDYLMATQITLLESCRRPLCTPVTPPH